MLEVSSLRNCLPLSAACFSGPSLLKGRALFFIVDDRNFPVEKYRATVSGPILIVPDYTSRRLCPGAGRTESRRSVSPPAFFLRSYTLPAVVRVPFSSGPHARSPKLRAWVFGPSTRKRTMRADKTCNFLVVDFFAGGTCIIQYKVTYYHRILKQGPYRKGVTVGLLRVATIC